MPRTTVITCDNCGRDLTTTSNAIDYRMVLTCEAMHGSGFVTLVMVKPALDAPVYFCGMNCLREWLAKEKAP